MALTSLSSYCVTISITCPNSIGLTCLLVTSFSQMHEQISQDLTNRRLPRTNKPINWRSTFRVGLIGHLFKFIHWCWRGHRLPRRQYSCSCTALSLLQWCQLAANTNEIAGFCSIFANPSWPLSFMSGSMRTEKHAWWSIRYLLKVLHWLFLVVAWSKNIQIFA